MAGFHEKMRDARKILVCDLGFLGDTIHLFPSLRVIRDAHPQAELHVMAADHVKDLLRLLPWVHRAWGYPRFPTSPAWHKLLPLVTALRQEKFDAVINLNGSNRSSFLTRLTGSPLRLGRTPERSGGPLWPLCYTHRVSIPYDHAVPIRTQRLQALGEAGFFIPVQAGFGIVGPVIPADVEEVVDQKLGGLSGFIHLSPFTTIDARELHPDDLMAGLSAIAARNPGVPWVATCADNPREKEKLAALLPRLAALPATAFPGTFSPLELCAVIRRARLHLGGDSGGTHIASLFGVPSVAWFRDPPVSCWAPRGPRDVVVPARHDATGFFRLGAESLAAAADRALSS